MNKETSPISSEQIPDIDSPDWDSLKTAPNETFNNIENDASKNEASHNKVIDRTEIQLKNALIDCNERFVRDERLACGSLADELSRSHLESLSRPVHEFGAYSSRLDSERFETLLEYLDQKFSTELKDEDKKRITDELKDTYFKDTMARAGLLAEKTDTVRDKLVQTDNKSFEESIHHFDKYRKDAPDFQVQIAKAYFDYFEEPTDKTRTRLAHKVGDYTTLLRREFGGITEGIVNNKIGSKNLPDSVFLGVAKSAIKNYEEMHSAVLKYYDHKNSEILESSSQTSEASTIPPKNIDLDGPSDKLPTDIF